MRRSRGVQRTARFHGNKQYFERSKNDYGYLYNTFVYTCVYVYVFIGFRIRVFRQHT